MNILRNAPFGLSVLLASGIATAGERVTVDNFPRVETDHYFKERVDAGCFGKFCHELGPRAVDRAQPRHAL